MLTRENPFTSVELSTYSADVSIEHSFVISKLPNQMLECHQNSSKCQCIFQILMIIPKMALD